MRILILGGTVFLGRALAEAAQARGHQVTLFNRGHSGPALFPQAERLLGDRSGDLSALEGRTWDAVFDTSGYVPRIVGRSAGLLAGRVGHYSFISSISAYADFRHPGIDEDAPVGVLADPTVEEVTGESYGPLKALCEQAVAAALPGRSLIIRPGLIVGPHDPTDRFTYWPVRVAAGGDVLAPGNPGRLVQVIDVRDLAAWSLDMAERGQTGTYNATGPAQPLSMDGLLAACREAAGADVRFDWVDEAFLLGRGVNPWTDLPLWIPASDPDTVGFLEISAAKAIVAGLSFRPLAATARDTLAWAGTRPPDYVWSAGSPREREAELLAAWRAEAR